MTKILAINGSYREGGITDRLIALMAEHARAQGAEVEVVVLREYPIEFCSNCRECTQRPGETPGECVQHDGMAALIEKIEAADGYILASPTNFSSVTALFKRFMERLVPYAYWPWGKGAPSYRREHAPTKRAVLVSSCAAPGIFGRWLYYTRGQLKITAKTIGAKPVGTLFVGLVAKGRRQELPERVCDKARKMISRLL